MKAHRSKRSCFLALFFFLICTFRSPNLFNRGDFRQAFLKALRRCSEFSASVGVASDQSIPFPINKMLAQVDHIYIVAYDRCHLKLPVDIAEKATCILGHATDECAPRIFFRGSHKHALKVSFTHAVLLQLSQEAAYDNIAVIEDDIEFLTRPYAAEVVQDFSRLLHSATWSMIRFGFRPYFLQDKGTDPCPRSCRCSLNKKSFGEHFCQLRSSGCDIRSSDLYVIHSSHFSSLQKTLLNLKLGNTRRIIDLYPMREIGRQWLFLPQISFQQTLDIPADFQVGSGALYVKKCVGPRPTSSLLSKQLISGQKAVT